MFYYLKMRRVVGCNVIFVDHGKRDRREASLELDGLVDLRLPFILPSSPPFSLPSPPPPAI